MNPRLILLAGAAFAGGAVLSACAAADAPGSTANAPARTCFWRSEVSGFHPVRQKQRHGGDQVVVSAGPGQSYLFETLGPCPDIDWTEAIGFDQQGPGQICSGLDVDLIVPSPIGPRRCAVKMIKPLTREEAKAY